MIKATLVTGKGPIAVIGINDENLRRLRAGLPLSIDIKELTPPGMRINHVVIHLAHTYVDVLKDMEEQGLPATPEMHEMARRMDLRLERERKEKRGSI